MSKTAGGATMLTEYFFAPEPPSQQPEPRFKRHQWRSVSGGKGAQGHGKWFYRCDVCRAERKRLSVSARLAETCPGTAGADTAGDTTTEVDSDETTGN